MTDIGPSRTPKPRSAARTPRRRGRTTMLGLALTAAITGTPAAPATADDFTEDPAPKASQEYGIAPAALTRFAVPA